MSIFPESKTRKDLKAATGQLEGLKGVVQALRDQQLSFSIEKGGNVNRAVAVYPTWDVNQINERYSTVDDVYAIIKRLAATCAMIPFYAYTEKKEPGAKQAAKVLKTIRYDARPWQQKALQIKALDDLPEEDPVYELLENPSDTLAKFEFYESCFTALFLHGELILFKDRIEVGPNKGKIRKFHMLFSQHVQLLVTQTYPQAIIGYRYIVDGKTIMDSIPPEDVIHVRYFNPNYSIMGTELRGLSPLRVLKKRLTRVDSNMNVSVSQMQNGGVPGIVYDKIPADETSITYHAQRKDAFYRYLQEKNNKGAPYFASGDMGYIELGLKLADMDVAEIERIDFKKLCNIWGISAILFNSEAASTESNVKEMRRALYTDACLPNVTRLLAALEMEINKDFTDKKRVIQADISEIPELQENYKDLAQWLNAAWWITPNEKREMMKFDRSDDPMFDQPLIPAGIQTLEDLQTVNDLPIGTENGT